MNRVLQKDHKSSATKNHEQGRIKSLNRILSHHWVGSETFFFDFYEF